MPQGSILGPLCFLVYIDDLAVGMKCNAKLFADDTSLFKVVENPKTAANDMNHDLELISNGLMLGECHFILIRKTSR